MSAERGESPHTIRSYANTFVSYIDYIERIKGIKTQNLSTAVLVKGNVLDFLAWIENTKGVTIQTRNQRLAAIHSFCRYLQHADITHCLLYTSYCLHTYYVSWRQRKRRVQTQDAI